MKLTAMEQSSSLLAADTLELAYITVDTLGMLLGWCVLVSLQLANLDTECKKAVQLIFTLDFLHLLIP